MRYLGIDLGTKTIGLALSDKSGVIATYYDKITFNDLVIDKLKDIINQESVDKIVLGFPKNMDNTIGNSANRTLEFKKLLEDNINLEVILEDERLTTKVAEAVLIKGDVSRKKRKKVIDGLAAVVILQAYLDNEK